MIIFIIIKFNFFVVFDSLCLKTQINFKNEPNDPYQFNKNFIFSFVGTAGNIFIFDPD